MTVNRQYFSKKDIEDGSFNQLLKFLMDSCYAESSYYNDIHIMPEDCDAFSIEWVQVPWDHSYGGCFEYVEEDQIICEEIEYPDEHFEYIPVGAKDEYLNGWLSENPGWVKNRDNYGRDCWRFEGEEDNG